LTITLSRFTTLNDPSPETLVFNTSLDTSIEGGSIVSYQISSTTGIGNFQVAEQDIGEHQDLGPFEKLYKINGFVTKRQGDIGVTDNVFLEVLKKWDEETKQNDNYKHGRFGILIDDLALFDIIPVGSPSSDQIGLLWKGMTLNCAYAKNQLVAYFEIDFLLDRGDDN